MDFNWGDPELEVKRRVSLLERQIITGALLAATLSLAVLGPVAAADTADGKKPGLEPVAASSSPSSKSAMGESPLKQSSAQNIPKPESAKTGSGSKTADTSAKSAESSGKSPAPASDEEDEKEALPFPVVSSDAVASLSGVRLSSHKTFPSAVDIHGTASGVLIHALKDTRYDLLSSLSVWLEDGPLLISVRQPTEMALIATKFGDVCVTAGGDALVERTEEDLLKIINLSTSNDTVFLNMHDKILSSSPWAKLPRQQKVDAKGRKIKTYEHLDSAAVSLAPGYELIVGQEALELEQVKPPDSIGRREIKTFEGGHYVVDEICIDNVTQLHQLVKNLNSLGERAASVYNEIMKNAAQFKSKQGESGFEKNVPKPKVKRKPPKKVPTKGAPPAKAPAAKPPSK